MQRFHGWNRWVGAMLAVGALAAPAAATLLCSKTTVYIVGADSYGCPSWSNGNSGSGKITKDTCTGIVVQIGAACVKNESGCKQCYSDLGYCIYDPWCGYTVTATCDTTTLSRPYKCKSAAGLVAVYNPNYDTGDYEYYYE